MIQKIHGIAVNVPDRCNCLLWAYVRYYRRLPKVRGGRRRGGYIAKRRSFFSPRIRHVFYSRDMRWWWQFSAQSKKSTGWPWEALFFPGHLVLGDAAAVAANAVVVRAELDAKELLRVARLAAPPVTRHPPVKDLSP